MVLCDRCENEFREPRQRSALLAQLAVVAAAVAVGFVDVLVGIACAAFGLAVLVVIRRVRFRSRQGAVKRGLSTVPIYRELLRRYPKAVVIVPAGDLQ